MCLSSQVSVVGASEREFCLEAVADIWVATEDRRFGVECYHRRLQQTEGVGSAFTQETQI